MSFSLTISAYNHHTPVVNANLAEPLFGRQHSTQSLLENRDPSPQVQKHMSLEPLPEGEQTQQRSMFACPCFGGEKYSYTSSQSSVFYDDEEYEFR